MAKVKPIYHILFWVFFFFFILDYFIDIYPSEEAIYYSFLECLVYITICYTNLYLLIKLLLARKKKILYFISLLIFLIILFQIYNALGLIDKPQDEGIYREFYSFVLNFSLFTFISFLYWYFTLYQQERQHNLALQNEKLQAELLLLKSQVSPHFLFNSLNNIYSLSILKHDNTSVMIEKLSDILRYIIYEGNTETVLLEREVELLNNYIDLHLLKKLKAEENITIHISGVTKQHKITPLLLINILENCFKHGDMAYNENGFLIVNLIINDNILSFSTENSYKSSNKKPGLGLENSKQQLLHYYPECHNFTIEDKNDIFKVALTLNL
ncbi:histidine kinase [Aquimarina sp. 2201CG5-10]|uniref:sensor histidine kinase n=1 Tax=Aquimarina callyspongiae TaxID=3098150 RepID=UPI002AB4E0D7|nr:histidine kinase [Aquimarina sp. 2201CG5-10]MDY8135926.1 histidine kinase [Aquimarina sp. 2201CG5-10]